MATLAPSPQPSDLHALRTACESRPLPDTAACSGFQPARPRMLAFPAARRLGARSPRRRGSPAAGRDGVSRVAVRRLPGRHGRRRLPPWRLCVSAAAAPYRLGLPGRACRPGCGRASRLTRAAAGNASPPSLIGLRQNPPGPEQNGQKTRGAAHRRRVVPPSLPRSFDKTRGVQVRAGTVDTSCVAFRYGDRAADLVHPRAAVPTLPLGPTPVLDPAVRTCQIPGLMARTATADTTG